MKGQSWDFEPSFVWLKDSVSFSCAMICGYFSLSQIAYLKRDI